ncbi:hypothetical protein PMAYCL1PPCAC_28927, partial [Pristionchus mayeri]
NVVTPNHLKQVVEAGKKLSKGQRYRLNKRMRVKGESLTGFGQAMQIVGDMKTGAAIGGGWYGGMNGAAAGATLGSAIPIGGTIVGSVIG